MYHKRRLYLRRYYDNSGMNPIKVYAALREIIPESKKLRGEGKRLGTHI